jgi:hypothetical protein
MIKGKQSMVELQTIKNGKPATPPKKQLCCPPSGWVKLSIETDLIIHGTTREALAHCCTGMILRDERGHMIYSACRWLPRSEEPFEAELQACVEGVM